jgi:hypothetical protein
MLLDQQDRHPAAGPSWVDASGTIRLDLPVVPTGQV